jgi:hypothetical protein
VCTACPALHCAGAEFSCCSAAVRQLRNGQLEGTAGCGWSQMGLAQKRGRRVQLQRASLGQPAGSGLAGHALIATCCLLSQAVRVPSLCAAYGRPAASSACVRARAEEHTFAYMSAEPVKSALCECLYVSSQSALCGCLYVSSQSALRGCLYVSSQSALCECLPYMSAASQLVS